MLKVSKVTTRSMAKARGLEDKPEERVCEEALPVKDVILDQDTPKEEHERKLRLTQAWDQGLTDEDMKKWAWGTGSAEKYPPGEQHGAWRRHIANAKAAYHRRDDLLRVMAITPRMESSTNFSS
jgi:hypothetical protein